MLEKIKLSMRIFHTALDADIQSNIEACMQELRRVGIHENIAKSDSEEALIFKAAEFYCKWQYDFQSKGEQWQKAFENLRDALSLCEDYTKSVNADV